MPDQADAAHLRSLEADLTAIGRAITLEARGRASGQPRRVTIGFIERPDGSLLVAASSRETHWARNLTADPACSFERGGHWTPCRAELLRDDQAHEAVAALILKYGTPAERLGAGPAFRLVPTSRP